MVKRTLAERIIELAKQMPVVSLTGPRQSGKSTLAKNTFPSYQYVNLEDLEMREFARTDPKGFLETYKDPLIIDEAQYVPSLFSYIQVICDRENREGMYILTGSQDFLLSRSIAQSLAGRVATLHLLPFSLQELKSTPFCEEKYENYLIKGFYPRIYDKNLDCTKWYADYVRTYIEKDARDAVNISDLRTFQQFVSLCAGRIGQIINLSSIGNDLGISYQTVKRWLNILEVTHIIIMLQPYHANFNKRIIKAPKLYFNDPGLVSYLLGIRKVEDVFTHYSRGALFENMIIVEIIKAFYNKGLEPPVYFWRDSNGLEVDLLLDKCDACFPVEIKSGKTFDNSFLTGILKFLEISKPVCNHGAIVYGGEIKQKRDTIDVYPWSFDLGGLADKNQ
jgi:predicted AAA+ superfamily ATPase